MEGPFCAVVSCFRRTQDKMSPHPREFSAPRDNRSTQVTDRMSAEALAFFLLDERMSDGVLLPTRYLTATEDSLTAAPWCLLRIIINV